MEASTPESYSIPFKVYAKIVGKEVGEEMKSNRNLLKSLPPDKINSLITVLSDEEYTEGPTPKFLFPNQLKKFEKMINKGRFDSAINYVQTFSGGYGQRVLHDSIQSINMPEQNTTHS